MTNDETRSIATAIPHELERVDERMKISLCQHMRINPMNPSQYNHCKMPPVTCWPEAPGQLPIVIHGIRTHWMKKR